MGYLLFLCYAEIKPLYIQPACGRLVVRLPPNETLVFALGKNATRFRLPDGQCPHPMRTQCNAIRYTVAMLGNVTAEKKRIE